jgi:hypothetical protein
MKKAFAVAAVCFMLVACGGGGSDVVVVPSTCAGNSVATIEASTNDVKQYFGGQTFVGCTTVSPGCVSHAGLNIVADGTGGSTGSSPSIHVFSIASVCKSASYPGVLFVSGLWDDATAITNAQFNTTTVKITNLKLFGGLYTFFML